MNRRRGFTLIELLTVAFIIAVLVAMMAAALNGYNKRAMTEKTRNILTVIKGGLDSYRQEFGDYPPSEPDRVNWRDPDVKDYRWNSYTNSRESSANCVGFYGSAALVLYVNGRQSDGYRKSDDHTDWVGYTNYDSVKVYPPRVQGVEVSSSSTSAPRSGCGTMAAGFLDAWGNEIQYFRAYRNRGNGTTADVFPRAVNINLDGSEPYRYQFPDGGPMVGGHEIRVGILRWRSGYEDYQEGWQKNSYPVNADTYLLVSPGKNSGFGDKDDVGNW